MTVRVGDPVRVPFDDGRQHSGYVVEVDPANDRVKVVVKEIHTRKWYPLADVRPANPVAGCVHDEHSRGRLLGGLPGGGSVLAISYDPDAPRFGRVANSVDGWRTQGPWEACDA